LSHSKISDEVQGEFESIEQRFCELMEKAENLSNDLSSLVSQTEGESEDEVTIDQYLEEIS
jgi:archaellum component FlaC